MRRLVLLAVLAVPLFAGPREIEKAPRRAWVLHPAAALTEADQSVLAQQGINVLHALPGGRYLARVRDGVVPQIEAEPLTAEMKLSPSAIHAAASGAPIANVNVVFNRDVTFDEARAAILAAGGAMDVLALGYLPSHRIEAKIPTNALLAVAEDQRVFAIAGRRNPKIAAENAVTAQLSHVTELYGAPYGLSGEGVVVSLFELAPAQNSHPEFGGRLTVEALGGASGDRRHATHVAGTIGAAGLNPSAKGMAPKSTIYQFCVRVPGLNSCTGDWLTLKNTKLKPLGVVADNNSWGYIWGWEEGSPPVWNEGDRYWGAYELTFAAPIDEISIDNNVLFVHAAGNDGNLPLGLNTEWKNHLHYNLDTEEDRTGTYCVSKNGSGTDCPAQCNGEKDANAGVTPCEIGLHHPLTPFDTLGTTGAAKNVISVGAVNTDLSIIGFSSRGPAKDGRVKPELVARGANVFSTVPESSYASLNGTSMSSPAVTGIAALLTEQWRRTFGTTPHPAQLKALLIAGADDLGHPGPDYTFGFGLVDAKNSVDLIRGETRIHDFTFAQGAQETREIPIIVEQTQNVRVVLNWADPALPFLGHDDIAAKSLVNNLDLRVVDPSGNTWSPWTLDKNSIDANAVRGVNDVDPVEMVEIPNAAPGTYRIRVTGTNVAQGPQDAVVVANVRSARPCSDVQESNNSAATATAIAESAKVFAGLCDSADVDFYSFTATKTGPVSVTIKTGDTPVRATLTGNGISRTQDIAANSTVTLNADVTSAPNALTLKIEAAGALGVEPQYSFTAEYPELRKAKRRTTRG
ncbi:MAG TPA: S8 family serine peptidase [Thermoanaerobaculia bacterium]|nr:S8 family serine peptidase [Thermoanaerobaculia bacterium]